MKPIFLVVFIMLSFSAQSKDIISWCAQYNWPPWIYPAGDNYDGILIEQLKKFEKDHNIEAHPIFIKNWKRCQQQVSDGHIDMLFGAYKTPQRERKLIFLSEPLLTNTVTLNAYTSTDNTGVGTINSLDELAKLSLVEARGIVRGKEIDEFISKLDKENLYIVNTMDQILNLILLKRYDYFFQNDAGLSQVVNKYANDTLGLSIFSFRKIYTMERESPVHAYIAFPKDKVAFEKFGNKWLQTLTQYHNSIDLEQRKVFHNSNAKNYAE